MSTIFVCLVNCEKTEVMIVEMDSCVAMQQGASAGDASDQTLSMNLLPECETM